MSGAALPSVSVVVPCYQAESWLAATLRSVLNQTHPPLEILVVDNGSTDRGPEIAESFGPPVRLLRAPERGASRARIAGAAEARGTAVMFLDADDLIAPGTLEALAGALAAAPETIAICPWSRLTWIDDGSGISPPGLGACGLWLVGKPSCSPRRPEHDDLAAWLSHWWHPPCSVLWSRAAYLMSGGWDPDLAVNQDGDLMMRAFVAGVPLTMAAGGRGFYRRPAGEAVSLSGTRARPPGLEARIGVLSRLELLLQERGRHEDYAASLATAWRLIGEEAGSEADLLEVCRRAGRRLTGQGTRGPGEDQRKAAELVGPAPAGPVLGPEEQGSAPLPAAPFLGRPDPLVSVVIPTYNRAAATVRAVQSVLAQDWCPLEVLVVDDASTDSTAEQIAGIEDSRLRLVRQPGNGGVARARNRGMELAAGEIIGFVDSDDEWLPGKLARQVPALLSAPRRTGIVHGAAENIRDDGERGLSPLPPVGRLFEMLLEVNVLHAFPTIALVKREVIETVGGFDSSLPAVEDWEFEIRAARFYDVTAVEVPVACYWDGDGTGDRRSRKVWDNLAARELLYRRYWREMRAAGAEAAFLKETAHRYLRAGLAGRGPAGRLLLKALRRYPANRDLYVWLATCGLPGTWGSRIRRRFYP